MNLIFKKELLKTFNRHISNIPGWRTNRKIVVFESDDWGSIRMPSKNVYNRLLESNIRVDLSHFTKFDSLEKEEDLELLFDTLSRFKDTNGNHPVFTALCNVANPDFNQIKKDEFSKYAYEPFTNTLKEYNGSDKVLDLWRQGAKNRIFIPQFHGREHLNVARWMNGLKQNMPITKMGFNLRLTGIDPHVSKENRKDYQAAFDVDQRKEIGDHYGILKNGIDLFRDLLGYEPTYFCAPNGPFNFSLEKILLKKGIKYLNTPKLHKEPLGAGKVRRQINFLGGKSKLGLYYITRNVFFEPSYNLNNNAKNTIKEIEIAFRWRKPAIISSHRVNYVGRIDAKNRANGLSQLNLLIKSILKKWPNVEFMSTTDLGALMEKGKKI